MKFNLSELKPDRNEDRFNRWYDPYKKIGDDLTMLIMTVLIITSFLFAILATWQVAHVFFFITGNI